MANFGTNRHPAYPSVMLSFVNSVGLTPMSFGKRVARSEFIWMLAHYSVYIIFLPSNAAPKENLTPNLLNKPKNSIRFI